MTRSCTAAEPIRAAGCGRKDNKKPYGVSAVRFLSFVFGEERQDAGYEDKDYNKYSDVKGWGRE